MPLPQPLEVLRFKQAITAVVIAALAVIMTIAARKLEPLLLLMPALYFLWMAWAVENDWEKGKNRTACRCVYASSVPCRFHASGLPR